MRAESGQMGPAAEGAVVGAGAGSCSPTRRKPLSHRELFAAARNLGLAPAHAHQLAGRLRGLLSTGRYQARDLELLRDHETDRRIERPDAVDRIVLAAVRARLLKSFTPALHPGTAGGAVPGTSPKDFIKEVATAVAARPEVPIIRYDIQSCFPSITWEQAISAAEATGADGESLAILRLFAASLGCGLPLGAPTSPLLAALVLREADTTVENAAFGHWRWIDDGVLLSEQPEDALAALARALADVGLRLSSHKTRIIEPQGAVPWLAVEIGRDGSIMPDPAALERATRRLRALPLERRARAAEFAHTYWTGVCTAGFSLIDQFRRVGEHDPAPAPTTAPFAIHAAVARGPHDSESCGPLREANCGPPPPPAHGGGLNSAGKWSSAMPKLIKRTTTKTEETYEGDEPLSDDLENADEDERDDDLDDSDEEEEPAAKRRKKRR